MSLKLRFTLIAPVVYVRAEFCQPQIAGIANRIANGGASAALAESLKKHRGGSRGDVQGVDLSSLRESDQAVAG